MISITDPNADEKIRAALKDADRRGKLGIVAAVVGIAGGEDELRKIMNSTEPMHIMDRGMIGIHI